MPVRQSEQRTSEQLRSRFGHERRNIFQRFRPVAFVHAVPWRALLAIQAVHFGRAWDPAEKKRRAFVRWQARQVDSPRIGNGSDRYGNEFVTSDTARMQFSQVRDPPRDAEISSPPGGDTTTPPTHVFCPGQTHSDKRSGVQPTVTLRQSALLVSRFRLHAPLANMALQTPRGAV